MHCKKKNFKDKMPNHKQWKDKYARVSGIFSVLSRVVAVPGAERSAVARKPRAPRRFSTLQ